MRALRSLARPFAATSILLAASLAGIGSAEARGCIRGAIVGGVAGHYAGHHGVIGAVGGCIAGRHLANRAAARRSAPGYDRPDYGPTVPAGRGY